MACIGDVYEIKNPLCGIEAEQSEADYGNNLGREVGVFDMVRHPLDSSPFAPRDQQSPPLRRPLAALDNSSRVAAAAREPWKKKKRERDPETEHARRMVRKQIHRVMGRIAEWRRAGDKLLDELAERTMQNKLKTQRGKRGGHLVLELDCRRERRHLRARVFVCLTHGYMYVSASTTKLHQHASESSSILGYLSQIRLENK